jgi:hypothetical protein
MAYGRPLTIDPTVARQCILPQGVDDEYLSTVPGKSGRQPESVPSLVYCYVESTKLQDILGQILATFYYGAACQPVKGVQSGFSNLHTIRSPNELNNKDLQLLLELDTLLSDWKAALPPHLQLLRHRRGGLEVTEPLHHRQASFHQQAVKIHARWVTPNYEEDCANDS